MITANWSSEFRPYGGYVDEVKFVVYTEGETPLAMLALAKGDIDACDERINDDYQWGLIFDPDIEVTFTPSVRYRALTLDCSHFPLNITAFRRAIAFGFDKYRANIECIGGVGEPQDSYIPLISTEWEVESKLPIKFYEADFIEGNKSLANAGFKDLDGDGWREYDADGSGTLTAGDREDNAYTDEGGIMTMSATAGYDPAIIACQIAAEGLAAMGVRAEVIEIDFSTDFGVLVNPPLELQVACWTEGISVVNPTKLLYDNFRTGAKRNSYYHFSNSTIDAILDQMINSTTLTDTKKYAAEAGKFLAFEQPQIVVYNNVNIHTYRTDKFEGFFEFFGFGTSSGENNYVVTKVHLKEALGGPYGGTFKYGLSGNMGTLNPYLQRTKYEATVFQYIYEKLWNIDPYTWDPIPGLAYNWDIEQTTVNGDIRDGQKFTFYLYENETWHDGEMFTAADINHSIYMWRDSPYHNPEMWDIYKISMPDGPDGHIIELYVNETGYFEWVDTTRFYITPEHIWRYVENVTAYSPNINEVIGTGLCKMDTWVPSEHISLRHHDDWRWAIRRVPVHIASSTHTESITSLTTHTTSHSSTPSSTSSTQLDTPLNFLPILQMLELGTIVFFGVTLVIIIRRHQMG